MKKLISGQTAATKSIMKSHPTTLFTRDALYSYKKGAIHLFSTFNGPRSKELSEQSDIEKFFATFNGGVDKQ